MSNHEKDLTQKQLEDYADVFADVVNALLYEGKQELQPEQLQPAPTETLYRDNKGDMRNQFQDISKYVVKDGEIRVQYMMENQTKRQCRIALRKAGYEGAIYRQQLAGKQIYAVVGLVLYWGRGRWRHPADLKRLLGAGKLSRETLRYVDEVKLYMFEMRHLPLEVRQRFHSDMRIVVDCLAEGEDFRPSKPLRVRHAEALVQMLKALTGDKRYEQLLEQLPEEGGEIDMCPFLDGIFNRGVSQGIEQGIERGEARGRVAGMAEAILEILGELGEVIDDLHLRIMQEENPEQLAVWAKLAAKAKSVEDFCVRAGI